MNTKLPTIIPLVVANMTPLVGVAFFGWDLFQLLFLYWLESAVIGIYNVLKMLKIGGHLNIVFSAFFLFHFGGFMSAHLIALTAIFRGDFDIQYNQGIWEQMTNLVALIRPLWIPLLGLCISHGYSYVINFLGGEEYKRVELIAQMMAPYQRITVMQVTVVVGGMVAAIFQSPAIALALLVIAKSVADIAAHTKEHSRISAIFPLGNQ